MGGPSFWLTLIQSSSSSGRLLIIMPFPPTLCLSPRRIRVSQKAEGEGGGGLWFIDGRTDGRPTDGFQFFTLILDFWAPTYSFGCRKWTRLGRAFRRHAQEPFIRDARWKKTENRQWTAMSSDCNDLVFSKVQVPIPSSGNISSTNSNICSQSSENFVESWVLLRKQLKKSQYYFEPKIAMNWNCKFPNTEFDTWNSVINLQSLNECALSVRFSN